MRKEEFARLLGNYVRAAEELHATTNQSQYPRQQAT